MDSEFQQMADAEQQALAPLLAVFPDAAADERRDRHLLCRHRCDPFQWILQRSPTRRTAECGCE